MAIVLTQEELDSLQLRPVPERPEPEPNHGVLVGSLLRGVDNLQGSLYGAGALIADWGGAIDTREWFLAQEERNRAESAENPAEVATWRDIDSLSKAATYVIEGIMENVPMMLPSLVTGGASSLLLSAGSRALRYGLGAYAANWAQEAGSIYADIYRETGQTRPELAAGSGALAALFDTLPEAGLASKVFRRGEIKAVSGALGAGAAREISQRLIARVGRDAAKQFLAEGGTEAIQTAIERAAVHHADPSKPFWTTENIDEIIDGALKGAFSGGAIGAAASVLTPPPPSGISISPKATEPRELDFEEAEPLDDAAEVARQKEELIRRLRETGSPATAAALAGKGAPQPPPPAPELPGEVPPAPPSPASKTPLTAPPTTVETGQGGPPGSETTTPTLTEEAPSSPTVEEQAAIRSELEDEQAYSSRFEELKGALTLMRERGDSEELIRFVFKGMPRQLSNPKERRQLRALVDSWFPPGPPPPEPRTPFEFTKRDLTALHNRGKSEEEIRHILQLKESSVVLDSAEVNELRALVDSWFPPKALTSQSTTPPTLPDFSEEARKERVALESRIHGVGPDQSGSTEEKRWQAIENTYITAQAAEAAVPGVPLRDVQKVRIFRKGGDPRPSHSETVDILFAPRSQMGELTRQLESVYPAAQFGQEIDPALAPYSPRKGEPSYRQWLAGARPQFHAPAPPATPTPSPAKPPAEPAPTPVQEPAPLPPAPPAPQSPPPAPPAPPAAPIEVAPGFVGDAAEIEKAKADLEAALADLADIFTPKAKITPEEEQRLIPVVIRAFDAAFRIGYYSFKTAARFVLKIIREKLGQEIASQITLDHLQSGYIGMAGRYRDRGSEGINEVSRVTSLSQIEEQAVTNPTPVESEESLISRAADAILERLRKGPLSRADASTIVAGVFGGTAAQGRFSAKDVTDIVELAVNRMILTEKANGRPFWDVTEAASAAQETLKALESFLARVPTQTTRTTETDKLQQFSTPPTIGYVAAWVANINPSDVMLEPSAGIGGLVVWGKTVGARVVANELSERRGRILGQLGATDHLLTENAEQLHARLAPRIASGAIPRPTVVVMNPPFSNAANTSQSNTLIGAQHVEQALELLPEGGRLVAIVGEGMAIDRPRFRQWWMKIQQRYNLRANLGIKGEEYAKYGTTFGNQLIVIDKTGPGTDVPVVTRGEERLAVKDLIPRLEGIRNDRPKPASSQPSGGAPIPQPETSTGERPSTPGTRSPRPPPGPRSTGQPTGASGELGSRPGGAESGTPPGGSEPQPGGSGDASSAGTGGVDTGRTGATAVPGTPTERLNVSATRERERELAQDEVFSEYTPTKAIIPGARPHPSPLVEPTAMAAVELPDVTYKPAIPRELVENGTLSDAQLEQVVYAGQAHSQFMPDGRRMGYFIGDGTGVGKGRMIAAIAAMDNWNQGRRKAVWVSKTGNLANDAKRDLSSVGFDSENFIDFAKKNTGLEKRGDGIAFLTYDGLKSGNPGVQNAKLNARRAPKPGKKSQPSRLEQLYNWLGPDFDGVIAFDEAHLAGNAVAIKGPRGVKQPSSRALAVVDIQALFPKARILYVSATGATDVTNLSYGDRLGIWGAGTPFPTKDSFFNEIRSGGLSAMEIVARDLKALGRYLARTLSFRGVERTQLIHALTPEQTQIYDTLSRAWQMVFSRMDEAMAKSGASNNRNAVARARSAFYGAQQRFYNQLLTAMQMPTVIADMRKEMEAGNSLVLQVVNTNEATLRRELAETTTDEEEADLETLDLSPKKVLAQFIEKSFPTQLYEAKEDEEGNVRWEPVKDGAGNPVHDPQAVAAKRELIDQVALINAPENPLEFLFNTFGVENVAEVTGRSQRVVDKLQPDGTRKRELEAGRSEAHRKADADAFNAGQKRILIFSDAGGTGFSYHAGKKFKNQQRRIHYLIQAGWRADGAIQGFGRTHRADQVSAPFYKVVSTNLKGHQRFISTISRRLSELGALTGGERKAAGGEMFDETSNLENQYAEDAVFRLFSDVFNGQVPGFDLATLARKMGFVRTNFDERTGDYSTTITLIDPKTGGLNVEKIPSVQQFLNRVLLLETSEQNAFFDEFMTRLRRRIESAKEDGSYDPGLQTVKAVEIRKLSDEEVFKAPGTSAATRLVEVEVDHPVSLNTWDDHLAGIAPQTPVSMYVRNKRSGALFALKEGPPRTTESGAIAATWRRISVKGVDIHLKDEITTSGEDAKFDVVPADEARTLWDQQFAAAPRVRTSRDTYVVGTFLPIWDRLKLPSLRVWRLNLKDGETLLGVWVHPNSIDDVRSRLGAGSGTQASPRDVFQQVLESGRVFELANGWTIRRSRVLSEDRIEITGIQYGQLRELEHFIGARIERINFKPRAFIPTDPEIGVPAIEKVLTKSPIITRQQNASPDEDSKTSVVDEVPAQPLDASIAQSEAEKLLGGPLPVWMRIVSDPTATTEDGTPAAGWFNPKTGQVTINAAMIGSRGELRRVIQEELLHAIRSDPAVQREWNNLLRSLTPEQRAQAAEEYQGSSQEIIDEEAVIDRIEEITLNRAQQNLWQRFWNVVKDAIARMPGIRKVAELFGANFDESDARRLLARAWAVVREAEETIAADVEAEPRFSVAGPRAASPESKRKVTRAGEWIGPTLQTYAATTDDGRIEEAKRFVEETGGEDLDQAFRALVAGKEMGGIEPQMGGLIATEILNRAGQRAVEEGNPLETAGLIFLSRRALEYLRSERSAAGQSLQAAQTGNRMLGGGFLMQEWMDRMAAMQARRLAGKFPGVTSTKLKLWLEQAGMQSVNLAKKLAESADILVSRALNQSRRSFGQTWREILTESAKNQANMEMEIYNRVAAHPLLTGLALEDAAELTVLLHRAWQKERAKVFRAELAKALREARVQEGDVHKVLSALPQFIRQLNLGLLSDEQFLNIMAPKYGVKAMTKEGAMRVYNAGQAAQDKPAGAQRDTAIQEVYRLIAREMGVPLSEILKSYWYASVLAGMGTQGRNFLGNAALLVDNLAAFGSREPRAIGRLVGGLLRGMRRNTEGEFGAILKRGQLSDAALGLDVRDAGNALESLAREEALWKRFLSNFRFVSRFMVAVDSFFYAANAEMQAEFSAFRQGAESGLSGADLDRYISELLHVDRQSPEWKQADAQARQEAANGLLADNHAGTINRRRNEILRFLRPPEIQQEMKRFGLEATLNNEPQGLIGAVARFAVRARHSYPVLTPLIPFVRISANVTNMLLDHSPAGLLKLFLARPDNWGMPEWTRFQRNRLSVEQWQQLRAKVVISHAVLIALAAKALAENDDDDPDFQVTGTFRGMTPEQRRQLEAQGVRPYQVRVMGVGFDYRQTPGALLLAALGNYLDGVRYQKFAEKENENELKIAAVLAAGTAVIIDQQFLSSIATLAGTAASGTQELQLWDRLMRQTARTATGLIPQLTKEIDSWVEPDQKQARGLFQYIQRDTPIARWSLDDQLNVLGQPIPRPRTPTSWLVSTENDDPLWRVLAKKAAAGVFVPVPSASAKVKRDGTRVKMDDVTLDRYRAEAGKQVEALIRENLDQIDRMSPAQFEKWIKKRTEAIRERVRSRL